MIRTTVNTSDEQWMVPGGVALYPRIKDVIGARECFLDWAEICEPIGDLLYLSRPRALTLYSSARCTRGVSLYRLCPESQSCTIPDHPFPHRLHSCMLSPNPEARDSLTYPIAGASEEFPDPDSNSLHYPNSQSLGPCMLSHGLELECATCRSCPCHRYGIQFKFGAARGSG